MTTNFTNKNISSIQINGENFNLKGVPFHGTEAEWNEISYTPKAGEIVVYDIDELHDYQRIKFGDGISIVSTLPFWQAGEVENIEIDTTLTQSGMAADAKTVGDAIILKANKLDLVQSNWNENDETSLAYIKNKPKIATDDEIIDMLIEEDMMTAVTDSNGAVLADENNNILLW